MTNPQFKVIKPTDQDQDPGANFKIFLAGSIDQGKAENWQERISKIFANAPITVFNPRRDNWDANMIQDISNPDFKYQVEWEMEKMDQADKILMYYDPNGQAPITLLELGLHANDGKLIVCCPDGYWRKGNIQVVCNKYNIPLYDNMEDFISALENIVK